MNKSQLKRMIYHKLNNQGSHSDLEAVPSSSPVSIKQKMVKSPVHTQRTNILNSISNSRTGNFEEYEYNMAEVAQAEDSEGYVSISFDKHIDLCLKGSYQFSSGIPSASKHINRRLLELFGNTGMTTYELFKKIVRDVVKYSNCYIILVRDESRTSGRNYKYKGKKLEPIAGAFIADPTTMTVRRNKNGKPVQYRQSSSNGLSGFGGRGYKTHKVENVYHLTFSRKEGRPYGTPYIVPALEDIRSLRRIEEMVEMLVAGHIFPLYQYIVGTEEIPAMQSEIEEVQREIEEMPTEGSIVTPERHTIKTIGAEGAALEVSKYLAHFENRVLATLRMSPISIGRGDTANKSTAASLDKLLIDRCMLYQDSIASSVEGNLLVEFLLDGGFPLSVNSYPKMLFGDIDPETTRANDNHYLNLYVTGGISFEEYRQYTSKTEADSKVKAGMYVDLNKLHEVEATAKIAKKYAIPAATGAGSSKPKKSSGANSTKSKVQPTNQYGTKTTKTKVTSNSFENDINQACSDYKRFLTNLPDSELNESFMKLSLDHLAVKLIDMLSDEDLALNSLGMFDQEDRLIIIKNNAVETFLPDTDTIVSYLMDGKKQEAISRVKSIADNALQLSLNLSEDYNETEG